MKKQPKENYPYLENTSQESNTFFKQGHKISELFFQQLFEKLGNENPNNEQISLLASLLLENFILSFSQKISPREAEYLFLAAKGKTVKESAKLMNVKTSTITT